MSEQDHLLTVRAEVSRLYLLLTEARPVSRQWPRVLERLRRLTRHVQALVPPPEPVPFEDSRPIHWVKSGYEGRKT